MMAKRLLAKARGLGLPEAVRYDVLHKQLQHTTWHGFPYPQREHDAARRAWEAMELALKDNMRA